MKKVYLGIIVVLIIAASVIAWQVAGKKTTNSDTAKTMQSSSSASTMQTQYEGYKGEKYDQMFLAGMIAHHQGAIDMANLALANAKHQEIKDLANAIVSAQTTEITSMTDWQKTWGYPATSGATMQDHSAMMMENEMASMTNELKGKTGSEFDKAFLTQMIAHHQEAIDMSKPAATNATHQEVKKLATNIIAAQSKEIMQMQGWQTQWSNQTQDSGTDGMSGMNM